MASVSPVKPDVLRWAIFEDGRPLPEVAENADVAVIDLQRWLDGDGGPSAGQLSRLSSALGRSRATLLLPAPPAAALTPTAFRRAVGTGNAVSAKARRAVRESRQIQKALAWIRRDADPVSLPASSFSHSAAVAAAEAREWTGISTADQFSWSDERQAFREWRSCLDARGIYVFALQIGKDEIRGFSNWNERAPIIGVNTSSIAVPARIFSLAHELGHLVCRSDATCEEFGIPGVAQSNVESWCESFAGAFLMPPEAVTDVLEEQREKAEKRGKEVSDLEQVRLVVRKFRVSGRAAALRLEGLNLAPKGLYAKVNHVFTPKAPPSGQPYSPPRATMRLRQYGGEVIETLMNSLPPRDALRILRIDALDARKLADEVPQIYGF
jgi:Zn-dependent peptidase ImmA (M78 family)